MVFAGAGGELLFDAGFTYNSATDTLTVSNLAPVGLTPGRVVYVAASGALKDEGGFTYDEGSNFLTSSRTAVSSIPTDRVVYSGAGGELLSEAGFEYNPGSNTLTVTNINGNINPSGFASTQVAYASATGTITSEGGFTYDAGGNLLTSNRSAVSSIPVTSMVFAGAGGELIFDAGFTYDSGTDTLTVTNITGTTSGARYADLAERFESDTAMIAGTVVELGGNKEVTQCNEEYSNNVFGVISTNAGYLMNCDAGTDDTHPPIAIGGRVPINVIGKINKGDRLVSAGNGLAMATTTDKVTVLNIIGRALEDKDTEIEGIIEAIVKIN